MPQMEREERDGIVLLTLTDDFTPELISEFKAHIQEALGDGQTRILVDAGPAKYINSTAFGAMVKARGELQAEGGELGVAALAGMPSDTFDILQLGTMIKRFATVAEGLTELQWVNVAPMAVPEGEHLEIEFRVKDLDKTLLVGADWHSAALQTLGELELQFLWHGPLGIDLFAVFAVEAELELRTSLTPVSESPELTVRGRVLNMVPAPEAAALVQVALTDPDDAFRQMVREFVRRHPA